MEYFSKTDIGRKREVNQDYVFATDKPVGNIPNLLIVADGMGGHKAGDYASKYTTETVVETLKNSTKTGPKAMFEEAITIANKGIIEKASSDVNLEGMGTTLVVATVIERTLYFANVGDSRLYVIGDEIKQLSKDHSLVEEMVRLGGIKEDEARHHPDKNIITRAIGAKDEVEMDFFEYRIVQGDIILMCTDGLSNMVEDEDVLRIVKGSRDLPEAVNRLIDQANRNGGKDNIGIVLADPLSDEEKSL